jgi:hypothetical protein
MEEIQQIFRVKNAPNMFRNKSVVLYLPSFSDHSRVLFIKIWTFFPGYYYSSPGLPASVLAETSSLSAPPLLLILPVMQAIEGCGKGP